MNTSGKEPYGVSVLICCYNSSSRLDNTLKHLANQQVAKPIPWEVILIDNNSSDDTVKIAQSLWDGYKVDVPLIITTEQKAGIMHARNKGFYSARFEFCLFCDDDNWLSYNYVQSVYDIMISNHRVGVLGGLGEAVHERNQIPSWFEKYQSYYAVGSQYKLILRHGFTHGAGSVFRRCVYLKMQDEESHRFFLIGRKGSNFSGGDDQELCYNYILRGYNVLYSENLKFKHFISSYRVTKESFEGLFEKSEYYSFMTVLYRYKVKSNFCLSNRFTSILIWWRVLFSFIYLEKHLFLRLRLRATYSYFFIMNRKYFYEALAYLRKLNPPNYYLQENS